MSTKTAVEVSEVQAYSFKHCFLNQYSPARLLIVITNRSKDILQALHNP